MKSIQLVIHGVLILSVSAQIARAATLVVPDQIDSVSAAVEAAASGDTILVKEPAGWVGDTLLIKDKDLTIRGVSDSERAMLRFDHLTDHPAFIFSLPPPSTLQVENAEVTLRFLEIEEPRLARYPAAGTWTYNIGGPIVVLSGGLTIQDCTMRCSISSHTFLQIDRSEIVGYSERTDPLPPYPSESAGTPAIRISNATGAEIRFTDSVIRGDHATGLALDNLSDTVVQIENCVVQGGKTQPGRFSSGHPGNSGLSISGCRGVRVESSESTIQGSNGSGRGMQGGHGLHATDSTIQLVGGQIMGGTGAQGSFEGHIGQTLKQLFAGGTGGHGLFLQNSHVLARDPELVAGEAGPPWTLTYGDRTYASPGGSPGARIVLDELSTYEEVSRVRGWMEYRE